MKTTTTSTGSTKGIETVRFHRIVLLATGTLAMVGSLVGMGAAAGAVTPTHIQPPAHCLTCLNPQPLPP